jgi:hypothetical protein
VLGCRGATRRRVAAEGRERVRGTAAAEAFCVSVKAVVRAERGVERLRPWRRRRRRRRAAGRIAREVSYGISTWG